MRVGVGYDVHAVAPGRALMLGCVHFDDVGFGLAGHSDADVVSHAVCDALLGAAGLGDIGEHFPDSDARWKDTSGKDFLSAVAAMVRDDGFEVVNVDVVVLCDALRLGARKKEMAARMASHLGLDAGRVNVKATTCEGHGAVGRGEIVACEAVALIEER